MSTIQDDFKELINDKSKSAEDIFNIMYRNHKDNFSIKSISREMQSWNNCLYQGTIGENDFVIAEASTTALSTDNTAMVCDNYKDTIIKFIELFRREYENNSDKPIISIIINISNKLLKDVFNGASRKDTYIQEQRNRASIFDEETQLKKYNISCQKGEDRSAVCCERNVTIGNVFQFVGFETYHVSGFVCIKENGEIINGESHFFTLVKSGKNPGKYSIFDIFNGKVIKNVLPGDYDLSKGFTAECYLDEQKRILQYSIDGPLYEITSEILNIEVIFRNLQTRIELSKNKYKNNMEIEENLKIEKIKEEVLYLLDGIQNSNINDVFKSRYIKRIQTYFINSIEEIENYNKNTGSRHGE